MILFHDQVSVSIRCQFVLQSCQMPLSVAAYEFRVPQEILTKLLHQDHPGSFAHYIVERFGVELVWILDGSGEVWRKAKLKEEDALRLATTASNMPPLMITDLLPLSAPWVHHCVFAINRLNIEQRILAWRCLGCFFTGQKRAEFFGPAYTLEYSIRDEHVWMHNFFSNYKEGDKE